MKKMRQWTSVLVLLTALVVFVGCTGGNDDKATLGDDFLLMAHGNVKEAYGEDYMPSMPIDDVYLQEIYGIDLEMVDKVIAEGPMMSAHVDTFIGIRAKEGQADKVEEALNAYRENLVSESLQYPSNIAKVNASTVYRVKDHVFFLMLGAMDYETERTEEEALDYAKEQVQIAVDAIDETVKEIE